MDSILGMAQMLSMGNGKNLRNTIEYKRAPNGRLLYPPPNTNDLMGQYMKQYSMKQFDNETGGGKIAEVFHNLFSHQLFF